MKYSLIILFFILSCSYIENIDLEKNIIKKINLDTEVWGVKDVLIIKEENISNLKNKIKCKEYKLDIYLNSLTNCYSVNSKYNHKNIIVDKINQLFKETKIYEKNECFTQKDFEKMRENEALRLKEKINKSYCVERSHFIFGGICKKEEVYTQENFEDDLSSYHSKLNRDIQKMTLHKKGIIKKISNYKMRLCKQDDKWVLDE